MFCSRPKQGKRPTNPNGCPSRDVLERRSSQMRRIALGFSAALLTALIPAAPALAEDNPCKGQAPGPHCRPMDCEIVWDYPIYVDGVGPVGVPSYKCYM